MEQLLRELIKDPAAPKEAELQAAGDLLDDGEAKGIWILAPEKVGIDQAADVTILGWDCFNTEARARRYLGLSGVVVATRVESRETFGGGLSVDKEPGVSEAKPADDEPLPDVDVLLPFRFGLRERVPDLPWRAGTYIVDVILDTEVSNRLRFQVTPGKAAERDPAIAEFIEKQRMSASGVTDLRPAMVDGAKLPNYRKTAESLPLPDGVGISLSVDRVSVYKKGAENVLRGSFRLPVPAAYYRGGDGAAPTASVPITLVVTGNDLSGPFVAPLRVATFDTINKNAEESVVTGNFEVDLFALPELSKVVQTYWIRAYSGEVRSELVTAAVITPEMLK
jgi:hypothetical protein